MTKRLQQLDERNGSGPSEPAARSPCPSPDGGALDGGSRAAGSTDEEEGSARAGGGEEKDPSPAAAGTPNDAESVCSSHGSGRNGGITPTCRICFQGSEQGELLSPCRCDGSVRYSHQPCLLKWISERGSWSCEICCYRYHVVAIRLKRPCQWEPITVTLVEKVQIIAVILGCLFLSASVTWLLWSAFSPAAVWQRRDILFQICYGMYGFMDLVCIGLIIHEGAAIYRVFKRWRAVNLHWTVLNYDKAKDLEIGPVWQYSQLVLHSLMQGNALDSTPAAVHWPVEGGASEWNHVCP
ncbi:E3 ubiquitin-protein ligase MARCHF11-like isoform X2 [Narcine bancroftii]|uniref:E3 ubiquitin-protein ligase MARCHF11-like isoform X2 n=1 Tax=Narcine bancroftii TaxID=1343680 RepID=UPI003831B8F6